LGQSPEMSEAEALLNEPIVLDDIEEKSNKKGHRLKSSRRRRVLKRTALTLMTFLIIGGAFFAIRLYILERHVLRGGGRAPALAENVDINKLKGEGDG
jgi:hypothetical protein